MSSYQIRQLFLSLVDTVVVAQLYAIGVVALITFFLLVIRGWSRKRFERLNAYYGDIIVNDLLENNGSLSLVTTHRPGPRQFLRHAALKTILLNNIRSIAGVEKSLLIMAYCALGYANVDRDRCYSMLWWRRLDGLSSLSGLEIQDSALIFDDLRADRNEMVALAATLALSGVSHEKNNPSILDGFTASALQRRNLFLQIANNWTRLYGPKYVFTCLRAETRDELIKIYVAALAELNSPEIGSLLVGWMNEDERQRSSETLVYILRTLKGIGDPGSVTVGRRYIWHKDEFVRAEALDLIAKVGEPAEVKGAVDFLDTDASFVVQRVIRRAVEAGLLEKAVA